MKTIFTIRTQLLALVMAIALPMVAILVYTIYENAQQRVEEAKLTAHMLAAAAASDVNRVLISNRDFLVQMAKRPLIRKMDGQQCDKVLWDFRELFPKSANMTVIDLQGRAICSAVPQPGGKPVSVAKAPWFKKMLASDDLSVSDPFFGPITGRWVTVLTYPIHDDQGKKIGFLGLPLDLALYQPNLSNVPMIPGTTIGVVTADGTFVWRNLDTEKWVGKKHDNNFTMQNILAGIGGEMAGLDAVQRLYHIDRVEGAGWTVYVGIPTRFVYSQLRNTLLRNVLLGLISLVFILGFAWLIARQISRPIGALASASRAIRQGHENARAGMDGPPEIREVAHEFNEMLNVRLQATAALRKSEAKLSEALQIARLGHWEYEVANNEFVFNDQYYSLHRTTAAQMGGYRMSAADFAQRLVHPDDAHLVGEQIQSALSEHDFNLHQVEVRIKCADGETRWVHVSYKVEENGLARLVGTMQDITERKLAEQNQSRLNRALKLLSDCNMALVHAEKESSLLNEICRLIVVEGGYQMAWVGFAEHDAEKSVRPVAQFGDDKNYLNSVGICWADTEQGRGPTGVAIRTGVTDINQNYLTNPHMVPWRDAALASGYHSSIALPLASNRSMLGALTIYSSEIDVFGAEEVKLLEELANDLAYGIQTLRTRVEHEAAEKQLEFLAHHDILTGLPNRLLLRDRFDQAVAQADREQSGVAVLFLDLDNFKQVNDTLGHNYGDQLLVRVVERLRGCLRDTDTISRQGGDEFVVLLPHLRNTADIGTIAHNIIGAFADPFEIESYLINTTFSVGVSLYPDDGREFDALLRNADTALYQAKDSGRDTYRFFSEKMNMDAQEQLHLQGQLRNAVKNQEFLLHYQPQIDIASGRIIGAEALVRWQHPELGLIPPGKFIPLAERTGLVIPMGEWVLFEACRQAQLWREGGHALVMAVNLSALQFKRGNLLETVSGALKQSGLPAEFLELELTESILLQDVDVAIKTLRILKEMGVKLSIDDFGTGYSSLSYLKRLAVNKLKIDQSFVRDLVEDSDSAAIVKAIIQLGHTLQLTVIAEGVETDAQLAFLRNNACDEVQGYLYSRPVPAGEFVNMMIT
ncbi:MAG: EAL domain-containing protein [Gallionellaceae bacterium]|jgi:diguanylate cyclase (GGDEF)-like protein/PAS domain S-box-containing protein